MEMTAAERRPSCTTPGALCYACAVFFVVYGLGLLAWQLWPELGRFDETLVLGAIGVACVANYRRNCTVHCSVTGPLFLVGAGALALIEGGLWSGETGLVWSVMLIGTGLAFLYEWRSVGVWKPGQGD